MPGGRIQPSLHPLLERGKQRAGPGQRFSGGGQNLAFKRFAAVLMHRDGHGAGVRRAVARLHGVAVTEAHAVHAHVLVAGEHEVEV